ncbi:MAG TPA: hypothetical protein DDZ80_29065, partial [Cyanobacteria bacterium UBA8803]|nr:hypothetical protein [Cyanobacteria bacterium UBA8803]
MKSNRDRVNSLDNGKEPRAIAPNLGCSLQTSIGSSLSRGKGWFPSFTVGVLTTVLATMGMLKVAKADDLQPELGTVPQAKFNIPSANGEPQNFLNTSGGDGSALTPPPPLPILGEGEQESAA